MSKTLASIVLGAFLAYSGAVNAQQKNDNSSYLANNNPKLEKNYLEKSQLENNNITSIIVLREIGGVANAKVNVMYQGDTASYVTDENGALNLKYMDKFKVDVMPTINSSQFQPVSAEFNYEPFAVVDVKTIYTNEK